VQLSRNGDHSAFEELVRRNIVSVSATAFALTGEVSIADDIVQETFLVAWQRLDQLQDPGKLRAWLCTIARNLAKSLHRCRISDPLSRSVELTGVDIRDPKARPDEKAITSERSSIVWQAIAQIPEDYRMAMVLYYREGQDTSQVAQALDVSEAAVRQRLSRGRAMLRREVSDMVTDSLGTPPSQALLVTAIMTAVVSGTSTVSAAGLAATAGAVAKGSSAGGTALFGYGLSGPLSVGLLGPAVGLAGGIFGAMQSLRAARTPEEKAILKRMLFVTALLVTVWVALLALLLFAAYKQYLGIVPSVTVGLLFVAGYIACLLAIIVRATRQIRQLRLNGGYMANEPPVTSFEERAAANPRQWRNTLIGAFSGAIFGSLSWLIVLSLLSQEFLLAALTVIFGFAVVAMAVWRGQKKPGNYFLQISGATFATALYTGFAGTIAWSPGMTKTYSQHNNVRWITPETFLPMTVTILLLAAAVMLCVHYKTKRPAN
jgi:RNA polymerase sigma factor (sigma-70 family)